MNSEGPVESNGLPLPPADPAQDFDKAPLPPDGPGVSQLWGQLPADIIAVVALSIVGLLSIAALENGHPVRLFFAALFLLFLPGYSAVSAIWPEKHTGKKDSKNPHSSRGITALERLALGTGLSIGIASLASLALSLTSGIELRAMALLMFAITTGLALLAWLLRQMVPEDRRYTVSITSFHLPSRGPLSFADRLFALMVVSALVIGSVFVAYTVTQSGNVEPYTEFYLLDVNGTIHDLPDNLALGETATLQLVLSNHENKDVSYNVIVIIRNEAQTPIETVIDYNVTVENSDTTARTIGFVLNSTGNFRLDANVYREGVSEIYISANLWVRGE